jgi:integrase
VLTEPDGSPVNPSSIRRRHFALLRSAGVPRYLMHEARHTAITRRNDFDDAHKVSRMVGHASVAYTMDNYWHPDAGSDRASAESLAAALRVRRSVTDS